MILAAVWARIPWLQFLGMSKRHQAKILAARRADQLISYFAQRDARQRAKRASRRRKR